MHQKIGHILNLIPSRSNSQKFQRFSRQHLQKKGHAINSRNAEVSLDDQSVIEAKKKHQPTGSKQKVLGKKTINYKLRELAVQSSALLGRAVPDCLEKGCRRPARRDVSRSVVWKVRCRCCRRSLEDYKPTAGGQPPLARAKDWLNLPDGSVFVKRTRCPQWAGSCWYYLRYLDAKNPNAFRQQ